MTPHPLISIVIPVYNSQQTIMRTLQAVFAQRYQGNIEVIVVDDGSTDRTASIVQSFEDVVYIRQHNAGPASARNRGAHASRGSIICFTDSDCVPHKNWIEKLLKGFNESRVGVVSGSYDIANPESILARCIHREIIFRHQFLMPRYPRAFGSYNFAVARNVFLATGGFNEEYRRASGEDNDFSYKVLRSGYRIYFAKDALVSHFHTTQLQKYLKEQARHGFWRAKIYLEHPGMAKGDDYTFWKDILEVPCSFGCLAGAVFSFFLFEKIFLVEIFLLIGFFIFQFYFANHIVRNLFETFYFSFVMFLRSFARMLGLSTGIFVFIFQKIVNFSRKKSK